MIPIHLSLFYYDILLRYFLVEETSFKDFVINYLFLFKSFYYDILLRCLLVLNNVSLGKKMNNKTHDICSIVDSMLFLYIITYYDFLINQNNMWNGWYHWKVIHGLFLFYKFALEVPYEDKKLGTAQRTTTFNYKIEKKEVNCACR